MKLFENECTDNTATIVWLEPGQPSNGLVAFAISPSFFTASIADPIKRYRPTALGWLMRQG